MEFEEIELIQQSEKSEVSLIREKGGGRFFIRKRYQGEKPVYTVLQGCRHPCLPEWYQVAMADNTTVVIEEYIEGTPLGLVRLTKKQFRIVVRDLCSVLEYLHGIGIIHRDIKPSNVIYKEDGHICLIDFDAARIPKDGQEQDTRLLGTQGYAAPEQYGFSQTDVRTDIYSLGVTLGHVMEYSGLKSGGRRVFRKCMRLDPAGRYQSVRQVKRAFIRAEQKVWYGCAGLAAALALAVCFWRFAWGERASSALPDAGGAASSGVNTGTTPDSLASAPAAERYPNQILWEDKPVRDYLGRDIDDVIEERKEQYGNQTGIMEEDDESVYREDGIVFSFDEKRKIDLIGIAPELCTYNGERLDVDKDRLIEILGAPVMAGWTHRQIAGEEEEYYLDYYDLDTQEGVTIYMPSPEKAANAIYID